MWALTDKIEATVMRRDRCAYSIHDENLSSSSTAFPGLFRCHLVGKEYYGFRVVREVSPDECEGYRGEKEGGENSIHHCYATQPKPSIKVHR